jgi:predicted  nucleic acid-binding Zn-ribbon protein
MKIKSAIFALFCSSIILLSCNNNQKEVEKLKSVVAQDSVALEKAQSKDTVIANYINTMGEIQDHLDSLKVKQKLLSEDLSENRSDKRKAILNDIKAIDDALIEDNRKIYKLEVQLKKLQSKNAGMNKMINRLTAEIAQKNSEIADLQTRLSLTNDSFRTMSHRFNDSINKITRQRSELNALTVAYNTVYYLTGTKKELKDKGAVTKTGGVLGIGRTSELSDNARDSIFIKSDQTKLNTISLNGRFSKLVTTHPAGSYSITKVDKKTDVFNITNPTSFWSQSKYLVIEVK